MKKELLTGLVSVLAVGAGITACSGPRQSSTAGGSATPREIVVRVQDPAQPGEVEMTLDKVPAAVRKTILEHTCADKIKEIVLDNEEGGVYDVDLADGSEFSVSPDGTYLGAEDAGANAKGMGKGDDDDDDGPDDDGPDDGPDDDGPDDDA